MQQLPLVVPSPPAARSPPGKVVVLETNVGGDLLLDGGSVVRVFVPRRSRHPYGPTTIAAMASNAIVEAYQRSEAPRLVVLPAGVGRIRDLTIPEGHWTEAGREATRAAVHEWVASFASRLPTNSPPVVVGLDGAVTLGSEKFIMGVQLLVVVEQGVCTRITWKTKPTNESEHVALHLLLDDSGRLPAPNALLDHDPVGSLCGMRTLFLVCYDAVAFAGRSRRATHDGTVAGILRDQYDGLVASTPRPRVAVNLLHCLPRNATSALVTAPIFQSAHAELRRRGLRVIAVSGINAGCPTRAFRGLSSHLACDVRHVDVHMVVRRG